MEVNGGEGVANDIEVLKKMEDEHLRLQRQVRTIQTDRSHDVMGVHPQFRRQDKLLRVLKKEYLNLVMDLKIASTGAHKKKDMRMKKELQKMLLRLMKTEQESKDGIISIMQLEDLTQLHKQHVLDVKKQVATSVGQINERRAQSEKRLAQTENRLETSYLRFNSAQYENSKIRDEIEHLLKDRALFNQTWSKSLKALCKGKKFLTDLFESSTVAYDLRDEWCTKLRSIMEKGRMEQVMQVQEMRDLQKAYDHEMKLFHFLAKKGVKRVNRESEKKEEMRRQKQEEDIAKELKTYVDILDTIYDYTEEGTIEKIIERVEKKEQDNFSKYQLLTHYVAENITLMKDLNSIRQQIADRRDFNEMRQQQQAAKLEQLRANIEVQKVKNGEQRSKLLAQEQLVSKTFAGVDDMFRILKCSMDPYVNLLGDKLPISKWTKNLTFSLMEEKIKEYLKDVYYYERKVKKQQRQDRKIYFSSQGHQFTVFPRPPQRHSHVPLRLMVPTTPCPACIEARWLCRVSETLEQPFNHEMALAAIAELNSEPAYVRSDSIHPLTACRLPAARLLQAAKMLG